jgi:SpoVK/Ycf46/Vps4 family AAA+-type ATPase
MPCCSTSCQAPSEIPPLMKNRLSAFDARRLSWKRIVEHARGLSQADVVRAAEAAARSAVLSNRKRILTDDVTDALRQRRSTRPSED